MKNSGNTFRLAVPLALVASLLLGACATGPQIRTNLSPIARFDTISSAISEIFLKFPGQANVQ